ncbi:LOW QUALITY PROTEIN: ameloblastin [Morphnus guianensis]
MRQYGRQKTNMLPQHGPYDYGEPFNSIWLAAFSHPWLRQRPQEHERQQYEYTIPVHPLPLPSQETLLKGQQPRLQAQNPLLQPHCSLPSKPQPSTMKCSH